MKRREKNMGHFLGMLYKFTITWIIPIIRRMIGG